MLQDIQIKNARLNNLQNITINIPKNKLVVVTGLSGSGKSTLIFDTLHRESQRQFMGAHGVITDGLQKPSVDEITALSPSIAIDQHVTSQNPRSTVGTLTEIYTYLRVLYARIGHQPCPTCDYLVPPSFEALDNEDLWASDGEEKEAENAYIHRCPNCGSNVPQLTMAHFSFNTPVGACPTCTGLGTVREVNLSQVLDEQMSILEGGVRLWDHNSARRYAEVFKNAEKYYGFVFDSAQPIAQLGPSQRAMLLYGTSSPQFRRFYPLLEPPTGVAHGYFEGIITNLLRRYEGRPDDAEYRASLEKYLIIQTCSNCNGERLRYESRRVLVCDQPITSLARFSIFELANWLERLPKQLAESANQLLEPILNDLRERIQRLIDVGVGYLTLERSTPTLSAGEGQRLRLASLLGSGLAGVLYILDEPSIGLHQRDTLAMINTLTHLRDLGNTVLVIEHDLTMIRHADYVIELGPGAGAKGGHVVFTGTPDELMKSPHTVTACYLLNQPTMPHRQATLRPRSEKSLIVKGARAHNLRNITVDIPLGQFVAVTGVSGSGKSSLVLDIIGRAASQRFYGAGDAPGEHDSIEGWEHISKVIIIDQEPIGRTPRSNAATYSGTFTAIRQVFASSHSALRMGLMPKHFSFNVPGGRCERCEGAGVLSIKMHFLPQVPVRCPACHGRRFKRNILEVTHRGYTIADVLDMTVEEVFEVFQDVSAAATRLALMKEVGLGYLILGQPATTLSGGEIQRIKLATELARRSSGHCLYLLDEPTTGLHSADIDRLLRILHRLVDADNTVVVIEHNLDVIKTADWIIDLGPEGGQAGGAIVAQGTPVEVAREQTSQTGRFLTQLALPHEIPL